MTERTSAQQQSQPPSFMESLLEPSLHSVVEQSSISSERCPQQFVEQVSLKKSQLMKLMESNRFQERVIEYNQRGIQMIRQGCITKGGLMIGQAQKILEYGANMGKQIKRKLIITILHNLAACHQKKWNLEKCSNYVQAVIYNYNCSIVQLNSNEQSNSLRMSLRKAAAYQCIAKYYLLFCAMTSQLKNNDSALISAKKGNQVLQASSVILDRVVKSAKFQIDHKIYEILAQLSRIKTIFPCFQFENILQTTQNLLYNFNNKCCFPNNNQSKKFSSKFKYFSVQTILNLQPINATQQENIQSDLNEQNILSRILMVSISYFMMATELRLISIQICKKKQQYVMYQQYKQSQIYHLISISIILRYFSFNLKYLEDIIQSYERHYENTLKPTINKNKCNNKLFDMFLQIDMVSEVKDDVKNGSTAVTSVKEAYSGLNVSRNSVQVLNMNDNEYKLSGFVRQSLKNQQEQSKDRHKLGKEGKYKVSTGSKNLKKKDKSKSISKQNSKCISRSSKITSNFISRQQSKHATPANSTSGFASPNKEKSKSRSNRSLLSLHKKDHATLKQVKSKDNLHNFSNDYFNMSSYPQIISFHQKNAIGTGQGPQKENIDNTTLIKKYKTFGKQKDKDKIRETRQKIEEKQRKTHNLRLLKSDHKPSRLTLQSKSKKKRKV